LLRNLRRAAGALGARGPRTGLDDGERSDLRAHPGVARGLAL